MASFPDSVTQPAQYGERIKALSVYLTNYQLLPWDRTTQMLRDLFGCTLSEGVLQSAQQRCAHVLTPVNEAIKQALQQKDQVHFDETGQRIDGKFALAACRCTDQLTFYCTRMQTRPPRHGCHRHPSGVPRKGNPRRMEWLHAASATCRLCAAGFIEVQLILLLERLLDRFINRRQNVSASLLGGLQNPF